MHAVNTLAVQESYADRVLAAGLGVAVLSDSAMDALERALDSRDDAGAALWAAQVVKKRLASKAHGSARSVAASSSPVRGRPVPRLRRPTSFRR